MRYCSNYNTTVDGSEENCPSCHTSLDEDTEVPRAMADGGNRRGDSQSQRGGQHRDQSQQGGQRGGRQPNQPRQGGQTGHGAAQGSGRGNWDGTGYPRVPTRRDTDVVGSRIIAQIVDTVVGSVLFYATFFVFTIVGVGAGDSGGGAIIVLGLLVSSGVAIGYFFALEGLWDGYTVGKKVFGIKVVKQDGGECDIATAFLRNLLRIIDFLPVYYVAGFVVMAMSDTRQRIGDRVANTVVVTDTPN